MDTKGLDQMLSVLRATAAQAGSKAGETPAAAAGASDISAYSARRDLSARCNGQWTGSMSMPER